MLDALLFPRLGKKFTTRSTADAIYTDIGLRKYGIDYLEEPSDLSFRSKLGLGTVDVETLIMLKVPSHGPVDPIGDVVFANIIFTLVSISYLLRYLVQVFS